MTKLLSIKDFGKRLIWDARYGWLALAIIVVALIVSFHWPSETTIRYAGGGLQLLGIVTVMWGIDKTRSMFGHPSFTAKTVSWMKKVFKRPKNVFQIASMSSQTCSDNIELFQTHRPEPNATNEQRLESLEKNIQLIHERISGSGQNIGKKFKESAAALESEIKRREAENKSLHKTLENAEVGGLHISAIGALWLFVGVILSTAAQEISIFLK